MHNDRLFGVEVVRRKFVLDTTLIALGCIVLTNIIMSSVPRWPKRLSMNVKAKTHAFISVLYIMNMYPSNKHGNF